MSLQQLKEHFEKEINKGVHPDVLLSYKQLCSYMDYEEKKLNENKPVPEQVEKNLKLNAEKWHKTFG